MSTGDLKITKYKENKGYVFISYSSKDKERVFGDYVLPLHQKYGLRVYCDRDFQNDATSGWVFQMTENLKRAKVCVVFMSSTYASSYACMLEVLTAIAEDIPIIKVELDKLEMTIDHDEREISEDTRDEYVSVMDLLKDDENLSVKKCIRNIKKYINAKKGIITKYQVSESFIPVLKSISGTIVKEIDAIKNSVEKYDVFEEIKLDEPKDKPKDEPKDKPKDKPIVDTDKTKGKKDNKNVNISSKINQILMVIDRVKSSPDADDYQAAVSSAAEYVSKELNITKSAVIDKCQRQLDLTAKQFQDLLMKHIVNDDDELFDIVLKQAKTKEEEDAVRKTFLKYHEIRECRNVEMPLEPACEEDCEEEIENDSKKRKATVTGDVTYYLYGEEFKGNQSDMMIKIFGEVLAKHPECIDKAIEMFTCLSNVDYNNQKNYLDMPSYFRVCHTFEIDGKTICVGTAYGMVDKLKLIAKLLLLVGEGNDVLKIEGIELPNVKLRGITNDGVDGIKEKGNLEVYYIDNVRKEGNQAKMMWDVFETLVEKYPEKIADLTELSNIQLSHNVTNPGTKESNPTCFMSYKSFMVNGQEYLVGTCYNKADKLRRISKMLNICGAPADFFVIE